MYSREKVGGAAFTDELPQSVALEYFITQKQTGNEVPQLFFGIEIEKRILSNGAGGPTECEHSGFFTQDRTFAEHMAEMLAAGAVTPMTLYYILDDKLSYYF